MTEFIETSDIFLCHREPCLRRGCGFGDNSYKWIWSSREDKNVSQKRKVSWLVINCDAYIKLLDRGLIPDCKTCIPISDFIFQQDCATSHTSRIFQKPRLQPLCHLEFSEWKRTSDWQKSSAKGRLGRNKSWLEDIRESIGSWKKRLRAVCKEDGGRIDHRIEWDNVHVGLVNWRVLIFGIIPCFYPSRLAFWSMNTKFVPL
jgi:hypothetical protein